MQGSDTPTKDRQAPAFTPGPWFLINDHCVGGPIEPGWEAAGCGWRMRCQCGCDTEFNPATERWEADHEIVRHHGGSDDPPNVRPLLYRCHKEKSGRDKRRIAKGQRQSDSIYGVKRPSSSLRKPDGMRWNWKRRRYERAGEDQP